MPTVFDAFEVLRREGFDHIERTNEDELLTTELGHPSRPETAAPGDFAWLGPERKEELPALLESFAGALLITAERQEQDQQPRHFSILEVKDPKLAFALIAAELFPKLGAAEWPDDGHAWHPLARIGGSVRVGPGCRIAADVEIGEGTEVGPNTVIAAATVGRGVRIGANCTIGLPGFGYARRSSGAAVRFPHVGRVVLEDEVEIGSNTCVDRGALGETRLGRGVKVDNLVHVAHNVVVEQDAFLIAHAMIGGSVMIGRRAWVAPAAAIMNQVRIGADVTIGLGAVVTKNVEDGATVVGNPARKLERKG